MVVFIGVVEDPFLDSFTMLIRTPIGVSFHDYAGWSRSDDRTRSCHRRFRRRGRSLPARLGLKCEVVVAVASPVALDVSPWCGSSYRGFYGWGVMSVYCGGVWWEFLGEVHCRFVVGVGPVTRGAHFLGDVLALEFLGSSWCLSGRDY